MVRTAGHVIGSSVLGSIEFGVSVLDVSLVVVLGHDNCGAVTATVSALETTRVPSGFVRDVVERVTPSVLAARQRQHPRVPSLKDIEAEHVTQTVTLIGERSPAVAAAVPSAGARCGAPRTGWPTAGWTSSLAGLSIEGSATG